MMGSSTALPQAPVEKTVFVEDMTDQQLAKTVSSPDELQYMYRYAQFVLVWFVLQ